MCSPSRPAVDGEIAGVLNRPRFARAIPLARRERVLEILRHAAFWFEPTVRVTDCRDPKDNKYLELALAVGAETIVSSDDDLLVLDPWARRAHRASGGLSRSLTRLQRPLVRGRYIK